MFQSLSGFQVRCNCQMHRSLGRGDLVSIPIGFSSSLQLGGRQEPFERATHVSIPIGFSSSLQQVEENPEHAQYRVE